MKHHPAVRGDRAVFSTEAPSLTALATKLEVPSKHFVLLVAADTRLADEDALTEATKTLIRQGLSYVCCWGPGCEQLETSFDFADIDIRGDVADGVVMTTSHPDEPLEEALWFVVNVAWPAGDFEQTTKAVVVAAINNPHWATEMRTYLDRGAPMPNEA